MSTDATSGVSYAVSGDGEDMPWIAAHQRDGTPVPGTEALGGAYVPVQADLGQATGVLFNTIRATPSGAVVAWATGSNPDAMVIVQVIDTMLQPVGGTTLVPPTQWQGYDEEKRWLTAQEVQGGWWVGAAGKSYLEGIGFDGGNLGVDNLSTFDYETALSIMDIRSLGSAQHGNELWLGFEDNTAKDAFSKIYAPYRVVRVLPGCVYPSLWDVAHQNP